MSMSTTIPATVQIKRTNLIGLVALAAILAAARDRRRARVRRRHAERERPRRPCRPLVQSASPEEQSVGTYLFGAAGSLRRPPSDRRP